MESINFKACAYYILRSIKSYVPPIVKTSIISLTKQLGCKVNTEDKRFVNTQMNMHFNQADNYVANVRNVILALNDAYQLLYIWEWVDSQKRGESYDFDKETDFLATIITRLISLIETDSKESLNDHRNIGKSITATYLANYHLFTSYFGEDTDATYRYMTNKALEQLGMKKLFEGDL